MFELGVREVGGRCEIERGVYEGRARPVWRLSPEDLEGEVITILRQQLEEQERLRDQDKKTVREKLDRVRQLLIQKIEEFENQQTVDGDERRALKGQVETLRSRLQAGPGSDLVAGLVDSHFRRIKLVCLAACFKFLA